MPISTERYSGFPLSKWELQYLRCRYTAHRNKVAAAKPAIDANPPPGRPHVELKKKKALQEERRQIRVVHENLRLLDRTMNIMASSDMPQHFSKAKPALAKVGPGSGRDETADATVSSSVTVTKAREDSACNTEDSKNQSQDHQQSEKGRRKKLSNKRYSGRPLTARLKRNTHIIFHWFIQRFGRYVPWWAEINY